MQYYSEIGKPRRRAIVLCRVHPAHGGGRDAIAQQLGVAVNDLIWVTNHDNWRQHIEGVSRCTLVLDPCNLTHEWCQRDEMEFALGIRSAFNNVVMAPQCEAALAKWLHVHNPSAYARMIEAGVCDGENISAKAMGHDCGPITPPLSPAQSHSKD